MGKIEIIEKEVSQLSSTELAVFRSWFAEYDATAWDSQIEKDANAGKLDSLADNAMKAFKSGQATEF
jgi:hypothetical protein